MQLEVPIASGDQRAWDGVISQFANEPTATLPTEFDSVLSDFQAQLRRTRLKQTESGNESVLWVIAATRRNRAAVREIGPLIGDAFPISSRTALRALRDGRYPGGSSLILL